MVAQCFRYQHLLAMQRSVQAAHFQGFAQPALWNLALMPAAYLPKAVAYQRDPRKI